MVVIVGYQPPFRIILEMVSNRGDRNTSDVIHRQPLHDKTAGNRGVGSEESGECADKTPPTLATHQTKKPSAKKTQKHHASLTKENLKRHTRSMSTSGSAWGSGSVYGNNVTKVTAAATHLSEVSPPPSPPHKTKRKMRDRDRYTAQLTPRKLKRIREFKEIDEWQLSEELVLF
ncbi:hypothetical protein E3P77_03102 [Wallemia ichthyophaga]|nr:hypothetical protein E3P77_03102 [Wallemia ichthyophaga]